MEFEKGVENYLKCYLMYKCLVRGVVVVGCVCVCINELISLNTCIEV